MAGLGDESIELSKLGTGLFAFGFVLVIGLSIFIVGRAITNDGSEKVQKQLEVVQQSEYTDYDQTTVLGTKVRAAMQNFEGKGMAILVATRSMIDQGQASANGLDATAPIVEANMQVENSAGVDTDLWCVNYNAVLDASGGTEELAAENGVFTTKGTFKLDAGGSLEYYNKTANLKKQGMAEYIPSGARYQASLIKDATNMVVGIVFIQVATAN